MNDLNAIVAANVARLRAREGLSLGALATRSGVGKATLSRLEAGQGNPTIETLYALADALSVSLGDLVSEASGPALHVRAADAPELEGVVRAKVMDRIYGVGLSELLTFTVPAGQRRVAEPHAPGVEEHIVATHGRLTVGPLSAPVTLEPGDLLVFAADVPHVYEAGDEEVRALAVMTYPRRL
jgi:transcriptional regulator with XRE-family HTH domain